MMMMMMMICVQRTVLELLNQVNGIDHDTANVQHNARVLERHNILRCKTPKYWFSSVCGGSGLRPEPCVLPSSPGGPGGTGDILTNIQRAMMEQ